MDFTLSEDQRMIRDSVREFAQNEIAPRAAEIDRTREFPHDLVKQCAELGLMGVYIPEEHGGAGMDMVSYCIVIEELSRACASTGVIVSVNNSLASGPIWKWGTEEQKKTYLTPMAQGKTLGAYALTEPEAGSDSANQQTLAVRKGDTYLLTGNKMFVTNGVAADTFIVYATVDREKRHQGICAFIVERGFPGFSVGKEDEKLGITASGSVELVLEECEVPAANRLGEEGDGFTIAMHTLDGGRIGIASQAVGIAQGALDHAIRYARERKTFGKTLSQHQAIQFMVAELQTEIDAARLLTWRAGQARQEKDRCSLESSIAKLFASECAMKTATKAIQIFGGYGYTREYPVERYFRDAKITEIYEGTSEIQRIVISKHLLTDN